MAKEDATGQAVESSMEQLQDINRKQSEIISAVPCRTTQRSFSWSFLNSSSEAAIFSAIVAILPFLFRS